MSRQKAIEAYAEHLRETDVKRAEQLRQIAQNFADVSPKENKFTIDDIKQEAKQLAENQPQQNKQNQPKSQGKFRRREGSTGPTPNQLKQAEKQKKLQAKQARRNKMKRRLGLGKKPKPTGKVTIGPKQTNNQSSSIFVPKQTQQQPDNTPLPEEPRTLTAEQMNAKIARERNLNQSNIADMQAVNNPNVAPQKAKKKPLSPEQVRALRQKELGDKKRTSFSKLPQSQSGSMTNITSNLKNILADLNNIKDPRVREEVKAEILNELRKMQNSVSDIGLDNSSQLILKMKINKIIKGLEE